MIEITLGSIMFITGVFGATVCFLALLSTFGRYKKKRRKLLEQLQNGDKI